MEKEEIAISTYAFFLESHSETVHGAAVLWWVGLGLQADLQSIERMTYVWCVMIGVNKLQGQSFKQSPFPCVDDALVPRKSA